MKPHTNSKIISEIDNGWLTIWFNSIENRNALSEGLISDLKNLLNKTKINHAIRGITLRGKGGYYCSGGDLKSFKNSQNNSVSKKFFIETNKEIGGLFDLILSMPQVIISYVEGAAIAGGLGLMCCSDLIVVKQDAKFSLTETMIGIAPAQIAPIVVARVGLPIARRLMLTGARFEGIDTPKYNLSDFVVKNAEDFKVLEIKLKKDILRCAPIANSVTKEILLKTPYMSREEQKNFAAEKFADCVMSDEGREGISSFFEKRKPSWVST